MNSIFVFTASNQAAQNHIKDTVENQILPEKVEKFFTGNELREIKEIGSKNGYYAWGAVPGEGNKRNWERLQKNDYILVYQQGKYTFYSRVLFKSRNRPFAKENWGEDPEGNTWEYIYLLEKPDKLDPPVDTIKLSKYFPTKYMGFMRITDERIKKINKDYGSLNDFFQKEFKVKSIEKHKFPNFWWVNQGQNYEEEVSGKYIWAPNVDARGSIPRHWRGMKEINRGDIIFHYFEGALRGISISDSKGYDHVHEDVERRWDKKGQRVDLNYFEIDELPLSKLKPSAEEIIEKINSNNIPFDKDKNIRQGYLFNISYDAAKIIRRIYGKPFPDQVEKYFKGSDVMAINEKNETINLLFKKKQIILYGPPGTGKTYNTKQLSLEIIDYAK